MTSRNWLLFEAGVKYGKTCLVKYALRRPFESKYVETRMENERTPIHCACETGNIDIVRLLIKKNCDIECEDRFKQRPIHIACENGHIDIVKQLIQQFCDIECEDEQRRRPIHVASAQGHSGIVKLLLTKNCRIDCQTEKEETPLDLARRNNHKSCVDLLKSQIEDKFIEYVTEKSIDDPESNDTARAGNGNQYDPITRENILIQCIRDRHVEGFYEYCSADIVNGNHKLMSQSFLEYAVGHGCRPFVNAIMKKTVYNKDIWTRSKNIAKENGHKKIAEDLQDRESMIASRLNEQFSLLSTAVCDNDDDMVGFILENNIAHSHTSREVHQSALALANSLSHKRCATVMELFGLASSTPDNTIAAVNSSGSSSE